MLLGVDAVLVTADADDLGDRAVGRAELQGALRHVGDDGAAILLDRRDIGVAILDLDAPMMDAGALAGELRLLDILGIVEHEGEVDIAVGHVARDVAAGIALAGALEAEDLLVEFGGLLEIVDLDGDMHDARHGLLLMSTVPIPTAARRRHPRDDAGTAGRSAWTARAAPGPRRRCPPDRAGAARSRR